MKKPSIGIVGGMGPGAGIDLAAKVISQTRAGNDQEHLPLVLYSFPGDIGDRTDYVLGKIRENPGTAIANILLEMEKAGVTVAGMACNSAHIPVIFEEITVKLKHPGSSVRLAHMVREVGSCIRQNYSGVKRVGIMGTTGTHVSSLYDLLEDYGLKTVNLTDAGQEMLHSAIYHPAYGIKSLSGKVSEKSTEILKRTCRSLKKRGAEVVVFACTELSLALQQPTMEGLPVIDTNLVLARALIHAFAPEKLGPWPG